MSPLEVFEVVLASRASRKQVIGVRPADSTAESHVQSPGRLVDEIVHVSLVTAIVITREQHPALVIDKHPSCEVNGLHARQVAACEYVPGGELDHREHECDQRASK